LNHPELKSSPAFQAFLKITDQKHFETRKKDLLANKVKSSNFRENYLKSGKRVFETQDCLKVTDFQSLTSNIESVINMDYKDVASAMGELIIQSQPLYAKIKTLGKQLLVELNAVNNTCWKISENYTE